MNLFKSFGIIFRTAKYGESSVITDIYTREKGLRSYIVNGVRKPKAKMSASFFQHGNLVDMVAYDKKTGQLGRIKELKFSYQYDSLPFEIEKSSLALFFIELARNAIREEESNEALFDFLHDWFIYLDQYSYPTSNIHLKFMVDFAAQVGFQMSENISEKRNIFDIESGIFVNKNAIGNHLLNEEQSKLIYYLMQADRDEIYTLSIPKVTRISLLESLIMFYRIHIESFRELKSYAILRQVF